MIENTTIKSYPLIISNRLYQLNNKEVDSYPTEELERLNSILAQKNINWTAEDLIEVLEKNEKCDKSGRCIIDTNGQLSCGSFCFLKETFNSNCPDLIWGYYNEEKKCALRMIINRKAHTFEGWYNTWRNNNLPII